jgi:hypothetical protein
MKWNRILAVATACLISASTAVAEEPGIVRAQSPLPGETVQQSSHFCSPDQPCGTDGCMSCPSYGHGCPHSFSGGMGAHCPSCYGHGCPHCFGRLFGHGGPGLLGRGGVWQPDHRYFYNFKDPGCMVYPQTTVPGASGSFGPTGVAGPGSPGAVVQYPYFRPKGPDSFFFDRDGIY